MTWLNSFGLTSITNPVLNDQFKSTGDTEAIKPSAFAGLGNAFVDSFPSAWYQTLSGVNDGIALKIENSYDLDNTEDPFAPETNKSDKEKVVQRLKQEAKYARLKVKNDWTPNPETTGAASQMVYGLTGSIAKIIGYTALTGGNSILAAPLFGADLGFYETGKLRDEGVDEKTANVAGAITGVANTIGVALPGAIGSSVWKNILFGAGANAVLDTGETASINFILKNNKYLKQAQTYDPLDPLNLSVSAGMGAMFGVLGARANRALQRSLAREESSQTSEKVAGVSQATGLNTETLQAIQNRDRSSKESIEQMLIISNNPDFNRLRESRSLGEGAPVVAYGEMPEGGRLGKEVEVSGSDGRRITMRYAVVEADSILTSNNANGVSIPEYADASVPGMRAISGNGRIAGVRAAYEKGTAKKYKEELIDNAKEFGLSRRQVKKMERPILVRIMDDKDITLDIGELSNRSGIARLNPIEQAQQDARNVKVEDVEFNVNGSISKESMDLFVKATPDKEGLLNSQGQIIYDNVNARMRSAIFAKAFGDNGLISRFVANDAKDRTLMNLLLRAAPLLVRLRNIGGDLDFSPDFLEAIADVFQIRKETFSNKRPENTISLFEASPAQKFFKNILQGKNADPERILDVLERFNEIAQHGSEGAGFFGGVTRDQVFETVRSEFSQFDDAVNSITRGQVDAAMELNSARVIQNDQPVGEGGNLNKSIQDELLAKNQFDDGESVNVSGEGVDPLVLDEQVRSFTDRVTEELVGAGQEEKVARMGAEVQGAFFKTLAERTGQSVEELRAKYGTRVRGESVEVSESYAQSGPQERLDLLNESRRFDKELKTFLDTENYQRPNSLNFGKPNWVLKVFGIPNNPVIISRRVLEKVFEGKHAQEINEENVRGLWAAIQNPVAVFKSATEKDALVLLTELKSKKGNVVVPMSIVPIKGKVHVRSVYPRKNVRRWIEQGYLLGYDKEKGALSLSDMGSYEGGHSLHYLSQEIGSSVGGTPKPIVYQNPSSVGDLYQSRKPQANNSEGVSIPPIAKAPKFDLITVARDKDGKEHRVLGVNGNPNLTVMPGGIEGVKPLPVRLQEETFKDEHVHRHRNTLIRAGYDSVEQAIWDIAQNYERIYKGKEGEPDRIVLSRRIPTEKNTQKRGILLVSFQEVAGIYRVGSVLVSDHQGYLQNRKLLWERTPSIRTPQIESAHAHELTRPKENISDADIVSGGQSGVNPVNELRNSKDGSELYQVIGEKGAAELDRQDGQARLDSLQVAREMESQKKTAKEIRLATGWERGADGKWRYEIADVELKETPNVTTDYSEAIRYGEEWMKEHPNATEEEQWELGSVAMEKYPPRTIYPKYSLEELVNAKELFNAYPQLKKIRVEFAPLEQGASGAFYRETGNIVLSTELLREGPFGKDFIKQNVQRTLVHEIQHAIQHMEGFAKGSNPKLEKGLGDLLLEDMKTLHELAFSKDWLEYVYASKRLSYQTRNKNDIFSKRNYPNYSEGELQRLAENYLSSLRKDFEDAKRKASPLEEKIKNEQARLKEKWGTDNSLVNQVIEDPTEYDSDSGIWSQLNESDPSYQIRNYANQAGEVEARNVSNRLKLSPEQRRETLLSETQDVATEDQNFLFQAMGEQRRPNDNRRGAYSASSRIITLFQSSDESTFIHESGHQFLDTYTDFATRADVPQIIKQDVQAIMDWFGIMDVDEWNSMTIEQKRPFHEKFARGFEQYLREGEAPSEGLRAVFASFKSWLTSIYKSAQDLDVEITPEIREVYARMLSTDSERHAMARAEEAPGKIQGKDSLAGGMVDSLPISEESKEVIKDGLNRIGIDTGRSDVGENHPRNGVFDEEQSIANQAQADLERDPNLMIFDEDGKEISGIDFIAQAESEARKMVEFAQGMGEAAMCMFRQGAFD